MYRQEAIAKDYVTAFAAISKANGYKNDVDEVYHFVGGVISEPGKIVLEVRDTDEETLSGEGHIINNAEDEMMLSVFGAVISKDITEVVANKAARLALIANTDVVLQMDSNEIYYLKTGGDPAEEADWELFNVYTVLMNLINDVRKCVGNTYDTFTTKYNSFRAEYISHKKNIVHDKNRIGEFEAIFKISYITDQFLVGETEYT